MLALTAETARRSRAYRAYRLDRAGRVSSAEIVSAEDDSQARRRVRAMAERSTIELWGADPVPRPLRARRPGRA
ncbi:hypothetical protein ACU4GR_26770 [Methylobacterium oryzae CBMB20]